MELAKKHWVAITLTLIVGAWYAHYAMKSYTNYIALRDAFLRTNPGQANPYAWTWFPFGKGNPFSY